MPLKITIFIHTTLLTASLFGSEMNLLIEFMFALAQYFVGPPLASITA
jgi:hypothetical protein